MSKSPSPFVSNVLKLTSGSIVAQGLGILVAPILTRLFVPEAFGVAALFASITSIIGVVACLRYELSIMLPKTNKEGGRNVVFGADHEKIVDAAYSFEYPNHFPDFYRDRQVSGEYNPIFNN